MSTIVVERKEWEQLTQEAARLMRNYEKLLGEVKVVQGEKRQLQERLVASEAQQQGLQQKLTSIEKQIETTGSKEMFTLKELRSHVARVLQD